MILFKQRIKNGSLRKAFWCSGMTDRQIFYEASFLAEAELTSIKWHASKAIVIETVKRLMPGEDKYIQVL